MAFNMQDVLLEPYGGEILGLSVSATTLLTALWAAGALMAGFALAARWLAAARTPTAWRARAAGGHRAFSRRDLRRPAGRRRAVLRRARC